MMMLIDMIIGIGLVAMFWHVVDKYSSLFEKLHEYLVVRIKWFPRTICVICISFWVLLAYFLIIGSPLSILRALACTPFVLELTHRIWQK